MTLTVIAECVDRRTGKRYAIGDSFPEQDVDQVERLKKAGCLRENAGAKASPVEIAEDVGAAREAAVFELNEIAAALVAARGRRDEELAAIDAEIAEARAAADARLAELNKEGTTMTTTTDPAAIARTQINEDGLFEKTVADLQDIAAAEAIDIGGARKKDEIVAAIRAARAAKVS